MNRPVYLDHHATTPLDARALEAMMPFLTEEFGNAASKSHPYGWAAEAAVATARQQVAALIGAEAKSIVFVSGATEANNLAIRGITEARGQGHVVTTRIEHPSVLDPIRALEQRGWRVTWLESDASGLVMPEAVEHALDDDTALVSVMHANNEIGTVEPIAAIGAVCRARNVPFHTDATQSAGILPVDVEALNVDALSLSAHKLYGPKGVGALYVRRRPKVSVVPQLRGGGHERGLRSGTLNVPGIVGFGRAAEIARAERDAEASRLLELRRRLLAALRAGVPDLVVHGSLEHRLPHNLNVAFPHVGAEELLVRLTEVVAASTGSACTSASLEPSHVLRAIGVPHDLAHASVRFGLGRSTTEAAVDRVAAAVCAEVLNLRKESPLFRGTS